MVLSKGAICNSKKSRFVKEQEVSGALNKLGIKTTLSKIPLLGDILFWGNTESILVIVKIILNKTLREYRKHLNNCKDNFKQSKMSKIINKLFAIMR